MSARQIFRLSSDVFPVGFVHGVVRTNALAIVISYTFDGFYDGIRWFSFISYYPLIGINCIFVTKRNVCVKILPFRMREVVGFSRRRTICSICTWFVTGYNNHLKIIDIMWYGGVYGWRTFSGTINMMSGVIIIHVAPLGLRNENGFLQPHSGGTQGVW